ALAEIHFAGFLAVEPFDLEQVAAVFERDLQRIAQALFDAAANREAVDDDVDGVAQVLVERDFLAQLAQVAVDFDAHEPGPPQIAQLLAILALAIAHDRREHVNPRAFGPRNDPINDLLNALLSDLAPAVMTERMTNARKEQAKVVINFRNGRDG